MSENNKFKKNSVYTLSVIKTGLYYEPSVVFFSGCCSISLNQGQIQQLFRISSCQLYENVRTKRLTLARELYKHEGAKGHRFPQ